MKRIVVVVDAKITFGAAIRHRVCRAGDLRRQTDLHPSQTRTNCVTRSPQWHTRQRWRPNGVFVLTRREVLRRFQCRRCAKRKHQDVIKIFYSKPRAQGQTRFFSQEGQGGVVFKVVD